MNFGPRETRDSESTVTLSGSSSTPSPPGLGPQGVGLYPVGPLTEEMSVRLLFFVRLDTNVFYNLTNVFDGRAVEKRVKDINLTINFYIWKNFSAFFPSPQFSRHPPTTLPLSVVERPVQPSSVTGWTLLQDHGRHRRV